MPTAAHSRQRARVLSSTPSFAATTNSAQSAARSPARSSPTKSAYPGVSIRLTLVSRWTSAATASEMLRPWTCSDSSKSVTVVPSRTEPARGIAPEAASRVSANVVFPDPAGPTSTTLRIRSGLLATRSWPAALRVLPLSPMVVPPAPSEPLIAATRKGLISLGGSAKAPDVPGPSPLHGHLVSSGCEGCTGAGPSRVNPSLHGVSKGFLPTTRCSLRSRQSKGRTSARACQRFATTAGARWLHERTRSPRPPAAGPLHRRRVARGGGRSAPRRHRPRRRLGADRRRRRLDRRRRRGPRRRRRGAGIVGADRPPRARRDPAYGVRPDHRARRRVRAPDEPRDGQDRRRGPGRGGVRRGVLPLVLRGGGPHPRPLDA